MTRTLLLPLLLGIAICQPADGQRRKKKEPPPPQIVKVSAAVPSLAALAETEQSQLKGGLRITMQPETYTTKETVLVHQRQTTPPTFLGMAVRPSPNAVYVERTHIPKLAVTPDRLVLRLQLNNQMPRVFRGSGIAVQFNVAGKTVPVDSSGYGDLVNVVLPPRSEQSITILGPPISSIPTPCTVAVFFFDVVTNMDQAGNVTEKQNFEWYFSYQTQSVDREISIPSPERMWTEP